MSNPEGADGGRLKGWSQRKLAVKRQQEAVEDAAPDAPVPEVPAEDPEVIAALPSLDDITADFDISPFLAKGVPSHLKNAAMRKLWRASPAVRDYLDPAVDYAWDWNAPGGVPGGGGVLNEQSVAKMVKDLIGNRAEEKTEEQPEDEVLIAETQDPEQPIPVAVRRDPVTKTEPLQPDADADRDTPPALPMRRHGGAVPE